MGRSDHPEAKFRSLFQNSPWPIFAWLRSGDDFIFTDFNLAAEQLTRHHVKKFIGQNATSLYQNRNDILNDMKRCFSEKKVIQRELISRNFSPGKYFVVTYACIPPDMILVQVQDDTEKKQMEEDLKLSEYRYKMISHIIPDFIYSCIHAGNGSFVIDWATDGFTIVTDYKLDDIKLKECWIKLSIHPEDRPIFESQMQKLDGQVISADFRILTKKGNLRWVKNHMQLIVDDQINGGIRIYGAVQDITERKHAEAELQTHRNQLEELVEKRTAELKSKNKTLQEYNAALKVLLQQREEDKKDLEEQFVSNIRNLVLPYIEKIRKDFSDKLQTPYFDIIESHLGEIASPMLKHIHQFNLTPKEAQVASLVKIGKTTKEIAEVMGVATGSIDTHRNKIRKKLALSNKKENLQSRLQSLT